MVKKTFLILFIFLLVGCSKEQEILNKNINQNKDKINIIKNNNDTLGLNTEMYLTELSNIDNNKLLEVKKNISNIDNELKKKIGTEQIGVYDFINYNDLYGDKIEELKEINNNYNKLKNINNTYSNKLKLKLKKEKDEIYSFFNKKGISNNKVIDIEKIINSDKYNNISLEIDNISNNLILENGEIVSKEFKEKYINAKEELLGFNNNDSEYDGQIPYEVVIDFMLNKEYIKSGQCSKINNEHDKILCESK